MLDFLTINWNPSAVAFYLPWVDISITWYGILFGVGFWFSTKIFYLGCMIQIVPALKFSIYDLHKNFKQSVNIDLFNKKIEESVLGHLSLKDRLLVSMAGLLHGRYLSDSFRGRLLIEKKYSNVFIPISYRISKMVDLLSMYVLIGVVFGARVAHILFYGELQIYLMDPLSIIKIWEGGLSGHGAFFGGMLAVNYFYLSKGAIFPPISQIDLLDLSSVASLVCGIFVRFGNFINQEIVGVPGNFPWCVNFMHPMNGEIAISRHPVQIYEALSYMGIFFIMIFLFFRKRNSGFLFRISVLLIFTSRFFLEFFKSTQCPWFDIEGIFSMGQLLSLFSMLMAIHFLSTQTKPSMH